MKIKYFYLILISAASESFCMSLSDQIKIYISNVKQSADLMRNDKPLRQVTAALDNIVVLGNMLDQVYTDLSKKIDDLKKSQPIG